MSAVSGYSVLTDRSIKFRIEDTSPKNDIVVNTVSNNFGQLMSEFEQLSNEFQSHNSNDLKDDSVDKLKFFENIANANVFKADESNNESEAIHESVTDKNHVQGPHKLPTKSMWLCI